MRRTGRTRIALIPAYEPDERLPEPAGSMAARGLYGRRRRG